MAKPINYYKPVVKNHTFAEPKIIAIYSVYDKNLLTHICNCAHLNCLLVTVNSSH